MTAPQVERSQVPRVADERAMLEAWLDYHRATLLMKCAGLSDERPEGDIEDLDDPSPAAVFAAYREEVERCRAATTGVPLDQLAGEQSVRWIYLHMIEEYARHNGHADLLRERIDGATGD